VYNNVEFIGFYFIIIIVTGMLEKGKRELLDTREINILFDFPFLDEYDIEVKEIEPEDSRESNLSTHEIDIHKLLGKVVERYSEKESHILPQSKGSEIANDSYDAYAHTVDSGNIKEDADNVPATKKASKPGRKRSKKKVGFTIISENDDLNTGEKESEGLDEFNNDKKSGGKSPGNITMPPDSSKDVIELPVKSSGPDESLKEDKVIELPPTIHTPQDVEEPEYIKIEDGMQYRKETKGQISEDYYSDNTEADKGNGAVSQKVYDNSHEVAEEGDVLAEEADENGEGVKEQQVLDTQKDSNIDDIEDNSEKKDEGDEDELKEVIELPVRAQKDSGEVTSKGVIELPVKSAGRSVDEPLKSVIELPVKSAGELVDKPAEGVIELPVKGMKKSDIEQDGDEGIIELPVKSGGDIRRGQPSVIELPVKSKGEVETGINEVIKLPSWSEVYPKMDGCPEGTDLEKIPIHDEVKKRQDALEQMMARKGLLRKKKKEKPKLTDIERVRLNRLHEKQHNAIKQTLRQRKRKKKYTTLTWEDLKVLRTKNFDSIKKITQKPGIQEERKSDLPILKKISPDTSIDVADKKKTHEGRPNSDEGITQLKRIIDSSSPARFKVENASAAPQPNPSVVPGVTFSKIYRCTKCNAIVNRRVTNRCFSCGQVISD